jgi:RHS repeat-associated protein
MVSRSKPWRRPSPSTAASARPRAVLGLAAPTLQSKAGAPAGPRPRPGEQAFRAPAVEATVGSVRSSTPTPWRLLTGLQTCLWAVLVLCLGSAWGSRFVPSDLDKSELTLESSFTEGCRYHYNALGQMDSTVDSRVGAVVNAYDALGRLKTITRPTGVATTYSYSLRGMQDTVLHKKGSTQLARFVYTYDRSGLRIGSSDVFGSTTTPVEWNHDSLMRLTQETKSGVAQSWGYDEVSNRTSQVAGGNTVAATFDIRDRLTSLGTTTYTWDAAGRLASRNVSGVGTTRLGWQDDDRLRRVDLPNGNVVDYTYDAQGLMATRTDASGTERYTWDGTLPNGQMIATTNASGALKAREVWGIDHLAEIRNDTILWLLTDGLGHVRAVTDSVGGVIGRQDFDAWGNRTLDSGRTVRFGYRGEWSDPATGLVYLRARWMDPNTGRFASEDRFGGNANNAASLHRYLYSNSSPIAFADPSGFLAEKWWFLRGILIHDYIAQKYCDEYGSVGNSSCVKDYSLPGASRGPGAYGYVDVFSYKRLEFYEIKPSTRVAEGLEQVQTYNDAFASDPNRGAYDYGVRQSRNLLA